MKTTIINRETGKPLEILRDVAHTHPQWVHDQCGTESEEELQGMLDQMYVGDWYADDDSHRGPDECGIQMFRDDLDAAIVTTLDERAAQ